MRYIITLILLTQDPGSYDDNGVKQINVIDWLLKR
ncbi:ATPase [Lactobacillus paragasseri]|nr:ATPase [Lactobacillus paragasseri]